MSFWAIAVIFSLLVGAGASPALRGAVPGIDDWIQRIDAVAAVATQFAALGTALLLVHLIVQSVRHAGPTPLVLISALAAAGAVLTVMMAQTVRLGYPFSVAGSALAAITLLTSAPVIPAPQQKVRPVLLLVGVSLGLQTLRLHLVKQQFAPGTVEVLGLLAWLPGLAATLAVLFEQYMASRAGRFLLPVALGCGLMAALLMNRTATPDASSFVLILGRTLWEIAPLEIAVVPLGARGFHLGVALAVVIWILVSRLSAEKDDSAHLMLGAVAALGTTVQNSPLMNGAIVLCGIAALVTGAQEPEYV